jgi:hypothetical protein
MVQTPVIKRGTVFPWGVATEIHNGFVVFQQPDSTYRPFTFQQLEKFLDELKRLQNEK